MVVLHVFNEKLCSVGENNEYQNDISFAVIKVCDALLGGECEECCVLGGGGEPEYQNEYLPLIERCQGAISLGSRVICITYV